MTRSVIATALTTNMPLELTYTEHICKCTQGVSPELACFLRLLVAPGNAVHDHETSAPEAALMNCN